MRITLVWDDEAALGLRRLMLEHEVRAANMAPAFGLVIEDFNRMEREAFESEGASVSGVGAWQPYAESTLKRRPNSGPLLNLHGALEKSLTSVRGAKWSIRTIRLDELIMGTRDPVAHLQQRGTKRGLPARPFLQPSEVDKDRWLFILQRYLIFGLDTPTLNMVTLDG